MGNLPASEDRSTRKAQAEPGTLEDARKVLWKAVTRAERILKTRDHLVALKAVHALSQGVMAYLRLVEVEELERRIAALEGEK